MIFVHGGAGDLVPGEDPRPHVSGCLSAARAGAAVLSAGGSALDAVIAAVVALEDDPLFNAGTGSVLNLDGDVECDASVMTGELQAGAVGAVRGVKNPIRLARLVMEKTRHVLLVADGALRFAREQGVALVDPASMVTDRARSRWASPGTVGAVARDRRGHLAAATSTGGTSRKLPGRLGDTPLIGCGTYTHAGAGAASATGIGEAIIKSTLTRWAVDRLAGGQDPMETARAAVEQLPRAGGTGGIILVDAAGRPGFAFNTQRMSRAYIDPQGVENAGFD
ncbi:MAG: isoaspartyl peptidase/L-asparaginase [Myxococcaceae bacterium]|nr:isoaspartyl peptidase/L-asparaginase [Myxococcaceae bacterium]